MKLSEALDRLCIATRANGRAPRTVASYYHKVTPLVEFLGDPEIDAITVHDVRAYVADLMDQDLSPFTVATRMRHAKRLFNWLAAEGDLEDNPTNRVRTPTPRRSKPKGIHPEDLQALLEDTEGARLYDLRDRAIILLLADSGARVGGLCGLKADDLDLDAGLATVTEKGGKVRQICFTETTAEALRVWLQAAEIEEGPVFLGLGARSDGALTPHGLAEMLRRRSERIDTKGPTNPHAFRHGFARHYLLDGGDLGTLSDLLGHRGVAITKDYYGVFLMAELKAKHSQHSPVTAIMGDNGHE